MGGPGTIRNAIACLILFGLLAAFLIATGGSI